MGGGAGQRKEQDLALLEENCFAREVPGLCAELRRGLGKLGQGGSVWSSLLERRKGWKLSPKAKLPEAVRSNFYDKPHSFFLLDLGSLGLTVLPTVLPLRFP